MVEKKSKPSLEEPHRHPRNQHNNKYNFPDLIIALPELAPFVKTNAYGNESINFFDPMAVKMLNKALLKKHYGVAKENEKEPHLRLFLMGLKITFIRNLLNNLDKLQVVPFGSQG